MREQKGIISIYVLFGMLFLLVFVLSAYIGIRNKLKLEDYKNLEMKEIYSKNIDTVKNIEFAEKNELIPIYNINQFNIVGTGGFLQINNKIYECGIGMFYILKNDIIVDIDEDLKYKKVTFNDYKLYSSTYHIDKLSNQIFYYKDGSYWICVAHQKFSKNEKNIVNNKTYLEHKFSLIGDYKFNNTNQFMMIWEDEEGNFNNVDTSIQSGNITSINEIDVFRKNYQKLYRNNSEYFIFVNIEENI